jgi:BolA family transcriptional regulator, general stress-responsive regulator
MKIKELIIILEKKLKNNIKIEKLNIEDKSFLHKKHKSYDKNKFHIKLIFYSNELKSMTSLNANRKVFDILKIEIKNYIHSLQIKII